MVAVSDLNKNFGGSTDLAKQKARIGGFAYPYSPPLTPLMSRIEPSYKFCTIFRFTFKFNKFCDKMYKIYILPERFFGTNFANFTIFRFTFKFNKFCDKMYKIYMLPERFFGTLCRNLQFHANRPLDSTRYTKIRSLNDFSVRCAEIYNFMLIDQQAPACRFYKIYKI